MKKLVVIGVALGLALSLTGCESLNNTPGSREMAHKRCVEAQGKWEETAQAWRCNS